MLVVPLGSLPDMSAETSSRHPGGAVERVSRHLSVLTLFNSHSLVEHLLFAESCCTRGTDE